MLEADQIELKIHQHLLADIPAKDCAVKLISELNSIGSETLSFRALEILSFFSIQAGALEELIHFLGAQLKDDISFPWGHFAEALCRYNPVAAKRLSQFILEGAQEQQMMDHLALSELVNEWEDFSSRRSARVASFQDQWNQKVAELKSQIDLCVSQNLEDEEERLLLRLSLLAPKDPLLENRSKNIAKRKIQNAIDNEIVRSPKKSQFVIPKKEELSQEMQSTLDQIIASMKMAAKSAPEMTTDFSVALIMMNEPEKSLDFISESSADFFKIEVLLKAHKNLKVLDLLDQYEIARPDLDPFDLTYFRAQAYWGLGRKKEAIELLESICKMKPDFRLAESILEDWRIQLSQDWS